MLWGFSFAAISVGAGVVFLVISILLLILGRKSRAITVPIPRLGQISAPPWFAVMLVSAALIGVPTWRSFERPERLSISGRIMFPAGRTLASVVVSVVPSSHTTLTLADGTYSLRIPKGEEGMQYQALVYLPNTNPPEYYLGVVLL